MLQGALDWTVAVLSLVLACQGAFTLYLMLYTWWRPERLSTTRSPSTYERPRLRFTALVPAREEQEVIAETIARVWSVNYPRELLEVVVICERSDQATIRTARRAIRSIRHPHVRLAVFRD